jgi:hypothetical protein
LDHRLFLESRRSGPLAPAAFLRLEATMKKKPTKKGGKGC